MTACLPRNVVVTGAAGGMGGAVVARLAEAGSRVLMVDVADAAEVPDGCVYAQGDVADPAFLEGAIGDFGAERGIDGLVNAAGVLWFDRDASLLDVDLDVWHRVLAINLTGAVLAARFTAPWMTRAGGGSMVHISSIQALRGDAKAQDAYGASMGALLSLSKSLAIQLAGDGIRSNALLPGAIHTPMQQRWTDDPQMAERVAQSVPLGRLGRAEDIAAATLFLLSDAASYITGTELIVDGGVTALP